MLEQKEITQKTNWLEKLALESWQGEMIVSGAAVFGSFQLPGILKSLIHFVLTRFKEEVLGLMYYVFFYLTLAATVLIVAFVAHFILRSIWIGTVGLWSVYPKGINMETNRYSPSFLRQAKEEHGELEGFVSRLDNLCSMVFALAFSIVMNFLSLSLLLTSFIFFAYILNLLIPQLPFSAIVAALIVLVMIPIFLLSLLNRKTWREKPWVEKLHYPIFQRLIGKLVYNVFYEPVFHINFVFLTNMKRHRFPLILIATILFLMPIYSYILVDSKLLYLEKEIYFSIGFSEKKLYNQHYEDQLEAGQAIFLPLIASERVPQQDLRLFIPLPEREMEIIRNRWGKYKNKKDLTEDQNLDKSRTFELDQVNKYFAIVLNGQPLTSLGYHFADHPSSKDSGVVTYIPSDSLHLGSNELKVISTYYLLKGQKKENSIPFWCDAKD
jgi:hypothetical protein